MINSYGTDWYKSGGFPDGTFSREHVVPLPNGLVLVVVPWQPGEKEKR